MKDDVSGNIRPRLERHARRYNGRMDKRAWDRIEQLTVALNEWMYAEGAGLEAPGDVGAARGAALATQYAEALESEVSEGRGFMVDSWAEARRVVVENEISCAMDRVLSVPTLASSEGALNWRNWKTYEREAAGGLALQDGFDALLACSAGLTPVLMKSLACLRADYGQFGTTPAHTFAVREGLTVEGLRALLVQVGHGCRDLFQESLDSLSQQVFGRAAGPAEVRALYLNRMYEPNSTRFTAGEAISQTLAAFSGVGFDLSRVPVDVEARPRKYPGAFCFPVRTPDDVRVSVKMASAHHLVDMLYHELGHAVHFSGIAAACSFLDRNWITSGIHETFSTLFESLLSEPLFLQENFGFEAEAVEALLAFGRFKDTLTATWLGASGLTALEAWLENLSWEAIEQRYAAHMLAFTGVAFPPEFARLESFISNVSIYPAGYVVAWARVGNWRQHLRTIGGEAWWRSAAALDDIRARVAAGGAGMFPAAWTRPEAFLVQLHERPIMGGAP